MDKLKILSTKELGNEVDELLDAVWHAGFKLAEYDIMQREKDGEVIPGDERDNLKKFFFEKYNNDIWLRAARIKRTLESEGLIKDSNFIEPNP